jgi:hypothetical protein
MIAEMLAGEHAEMDRLLAAGEFDAFRRLLLRHIALEEKILLPAAREARGGEPLPIAAQLRRDHAEIAALLAPSPTTETIRQLRELLSRHNPLEEGPQGLYETCERLFGPDRSREILERLRTMPAVRVARYRNLKRSS